MDRRALMTTAVAAGLTAGDAVAAPARPNILFILADDLGWRDLGCYGERRIRTPQIDRLAGQGVRLLQAYANSCVCTPSRVSLMTGRYPHRLAVGKDDVLGRSAEGSDRLGLPPDHPTLASLLRGAGYRTALVGKWHLGFPPHFGPLKSGYERFYGIHAGGADYFTHRTSVGPGPSGLFDQTMPVDRQGYLTALLADRAVDELTQAAAERRPFLLSLHFTAPHWPWEGPRDAAVASTLTSLQHHDGGSLETYAAMVESLDRNVGRVLAALDRLDQSKNTLVVFTSDNGGERFSDMWPLRGQKTDLLEGGVRVPALVRWPGRIRPGGVSRQAAITMDWLPTLLAAAGTAPDPACPPDGENLLPILTGQAPEHARAFFWRYPDRRQRAARIGDLKYLEVEGRPALFDVAADPREAADLAGRRPEDLERLRAAHDAWARDMLPEDSAAP